MAKTTEAANSSLAEFNFDDSEEFFGIKPDGETTPKIKEISKVSKDKGEETTEIKEVKTDEDDLDSQEEEFFNIPSEKKTSTSKKSKAGKQEDAIEEVETTDDEVTSIDKKTKTPVTTTDDEVTEEVDETKPAKKGREEAAEDDQSDEEFYGTLSFDLKERGIFQNVELPKDKKLTEDQFYEFFDSELEARVDEALENMVESLDEDAKRFLKFKKDGGKTHEFFAQYGNSLDLEELDVTNDYQVNKVLNYYVTTVEGLEGEELEDRIKFIKEGGKTKTYAQNWFKKIKDEEDAEKQAIITAAATAKKAREESSKKFNEEITALALKTETVGDFTFSKVDQKKIINSITKATVKTGKDKYVPSFQAKLSNVLKAATKEDREKLLILAKLVEDDFSIKDIAIKKKTEAVKETKSKLREAKTGVKAHSSGSNKARELSDYF